MKKKSVLARKFGFIPVPEIQATDKETNQSPRLRVSASPRQSPVALLKRMGMMFAILFCCGMVWTLPAFAAQGAIPEVKVSLGNSAGELKFFPNQLQFVAGQKYKLLLDNPSPMKHYFTAKDFADASWTQKVQAGKVEIKGAIHELELKPGGDAEWVFVPMKPGTFELHCSVPGHAAAGMTGTIVIANPS